MYLKLISSQIAKMAEKKFDGVLKMLSHDK